MPPRFAYWTILAGGLPTAFRAADRDELLPTFHRIKEKHPDAELKYFARGRLWASPAEARQAREEARPAAPARDRDWRPGGEHRDPRQRFRDAKKARNQERRQRRWDRKSGGGSTDHSATRPPRRGLRPKGGAPTRGEHDPRPPRPGREPERRDEPKPERRDEQKPEPPPRPSEPTIRPPGPPERGRRPRGGPPRGREGRRR